MTRCYDGWFALADFQEVSALRVHVVVYDSSTEMILLANQQTQFLKQVYCATPSPA
jgi:hypothetical protein